MLHHLFKTLLLTLCLLCFGFAQTTFAAQAKFKPQTINSRAELLKLIKTHQTNHFRQYYLYDFAMPVFALNSEASPASAGATSTSNTVSHSDTNIQVQGVDEADIVKVGDDGYIYQVHGGQVRIIKGFPVSAMKQEAALTFPDSRFYPTGIYIQNGKLAIFGTSWESWQQPVSKPETGTTSDQTIAYPLYCCGWWNSYSQTRVLIYDVSDHANPVQIRDLSIDGDYVDSRRVGDNLYFVSRTYPHYYMYNTGTATTVKVSDLLPSIVDTQGGKKSKKMLALNDLFYFPGFVEPDYAVVASVNLQHPEQSVNTKAYLGAGEMIYASTQNLYLSASKYNFANVWGGGIMPLAIAKTKTSAKVADNSVTTQIFKFGIQDGQINFAAAGEVPGTVLNQFSMDENGDYFRIATTTQAWVSGTNQSQNALFVLNKDMTIVGKLENLAPGEQIYSTRFMGNRCYIVTFRLVDPLFAIDLTTPENPTVLGELKIPGYSNYLHPYDETHLIGFGKDAAVYQSEQANADQSWANGGAFYQGLKVALFDVADMKNPKELYSVTIGDRGSDSPLLWNHKALYWDSERHLFGFPANVTKLDKPFDAKQPWLYGSPVYQGAFIYEVTPEKGFTLKARLSQIPKDMSPVKVDYGNGYSYTYWDNKAVDLFVNRLFRIDTNLYTLSNNQINVYDLVNYQEQGKLPLMENNSVSKRAKK